MSSVRSVRRGSRSGGKKCASTIGVAIGRAPATRPPGNLAARRRRGVPRLAPRSRDRGSERRAHHFSRFYAGKVEGVRKSEARARARRNAGTPAEAAERAEPQDLTHSERADSGRGRRRTVWYRSVFSRTSNPRVYRLKDFPTSGRRRVSLGRGAMKTRDFDVDPPPVAPRSVRLVPQPPVRVAR